MQNKNRINVTVQQINNIRFNLINISMKICVYAICKNEMKFVHRWYNSVREADYVCVLDTGSTDGTYEAVQKLGIIAAQKKYDFFRFDVARNDSMALIPDDADVCVCVDLDEFFAPGWADNLRKQWVNGTMRARYRYTWNFNPDGSEGVVFMADKIHANKKFIWTHPVHEVLTPTFSGECKTINLANVQLNHMADASKSRSNYLPLLELSVKEHPEDDRNAHYLGREYMFNGEYKKAIKELGRHLSLPTATWADERCASLRFIARCYGELNKPKKQEEFLLKAILQAPHLREPYFELGVFYYNQQKYLPAAVVLTDMLKISTRSLNYISSPLCWGSLPYDYLSICHAELNNFELALEYVNDALKLSNEPRLKYNRNFFLRKLEEEKNNQKTNKTP